MPPLRNGDMERARWKGVPRKLEGELISEEELGRILPPDEQHSKVKIVAEENKFFIYGRDYSFKDRTYTES